MQQWRTQARHACCMHARTWVGVHERMAGVVTGLLPHSLQELIRLHRLQALTEPLHMIHAACACEPSVSERGQRRLMRMVGRSLACVPE